MVITATSVNNPNKKNGIVNLTGIAARFVITTIAKEAIAAMISANTAPFIRITAIVNGKNTAVITAMDAPTQAK